MRPASASEADPTKTTEPGSVESKRPWHRFLFTNLSFVRPTPAQDFRAPPPLLRTSD